MPRNPQPKTTDGKQSEAQVQQEFDERISSMVRSAVRDAVQQGMAARQDQQLGLNSCDQFMAREAKPPNDLQHLQHLQLQLQCTEEEETGVIRRLQEIRRVRAGFIESIRDLKSSITLSL